MIVILPYSIPIGKKDDKFYVNLNQYRNAHYHTLNSAKISFKELIYNQVKQLPKLHIIKLWYRVYPPSKRLIDTNNICSIADKFFCDALVEAGKLEDDNYKFLIDTRFTFGEVDKGNPRVEVEIEETAPMKMIFGKDEILVALNQYAANVLRFPPNEMPEIRMEATADGSFYAELELDLSNIQRNASRSGSLESTKVSSENLNSLKAKVATSGSRAAVTEALKSAKSDAEPAARPSLLNTTPKAEPRTITTVSATEDPSQEASTDPMESQEDAGGTEATADAPVAIEAQSEPVTAADVAEDGGTATITTATQEPAQITSSPENRKEPTVNDGAGQVGGAPAQVTKSTSSIFNFKNKS